MNIDWNSEVLTDLPVPLWQYLIVVVVLAVAVGWLIAFHLRWNVEKSFAWGIWLTIGILFWPLPAAMIFACAVVSILSLPAWGPMLLFLWWRERKRFATSKAGAPLSGLDSQSQPQDSPEQEKGQ